MNNAIARAGRDSDPVVSFELEEVEQRVEANLTATCGGCTGCLCPAPGCWIDVS
jgi:hypothetical protein